MPTPPLPNANPGPRNCSQAPPLLTCQNDPKYSGRLATGLLLLVMGALTGTSATSALHGGGLIQVGLGRLVDYLIEQQVPGIWVLVFVERVHIGGMLVMAALLLLFGRSRRPQAGPHEMLVFYGVDMVEQVKEDGRGNVVGQVADDAQFGR